MSADCNIALPAKLGTSRNLAMAIPARRIGLKSLKDVRREMAKVYREMRAGLVESQDGTKFIYVLSQIAKTIVQDEIANKGEERCYEDYLREIHDRVIAFKAGNRSLDESTRTARRVSDGDGNHANEEFSSSNARIPRSDPNTAYPYDR